MSGRPVNILVGDAPEIQAFLAERMYEFMFLSTHSFQAPAFYERLGYKQQAIVRDHPVGHASLYFAKELQQ